MNRMVWVAILVVLGIVGLGFYRGWFRAGSENADGKRNVTLSMDTEKIQEDKKNRGYRGGKLGAPDQRHGCRAEREKP